VKKAIVGEAPGESFLRGFLRGNTEVRRLFCGGCLSLLKDNSGSFELVRVI
jgi:hypothetical protein